VFGSLSLANIFQIPGSMKKIPTAGICFLSDILQPIIFPIAVMGKHLMLHGDGVKDVAFEVEDCVALYKVTKLV